MTDRFDQILLERFAAQHDELAPASLDDVHRRKARSQPSRLRRPLVVAAAVLAAALVSAGAYAVVRLVIVGSPAPPPVRTSEQVLQHVETAITFFNNTGNHKVEVEKTKAAAVLNTRDGPVYLWMAPTQDGYRCLYLQITGLHLRFAAGTPFLMSAGCVGPNQTKAQLYRASVGVNGHTLALVAGYLPSRTSTLQLQFHNGTKSALFTTKNGFVIATGSPYDPSPSALIRTRLGRETNIQTVRFLFPLRISTSPIGPSKFTLTVPLKGQEGALTLEVAPAANGGSCRTLHVSRAFTVTGCGFAHPSANEILVFRGGGIINAHQRVEYLQAQVGSAITTVELLAKGKEHPLRMAHHWLLLQLPANTGTIELIGRNAAGRIVTRRHFP